MSEKERRDRGGTTRSERLNSHLPTTSEVGPFWPLVESRGEEVIERRREEEERRSNVGGERTE